LSQLSIDDRDILARAALFNPILRYTAQFGSSPGVPTDKCVSCHSSSAI
jgi:hypothetical protein